MHNIIFQVIYGFLIVNCFYTQLWISPKTRNFASY